MARPQGLKEAGSLGQVRQVPLIPCRESRREHSIARPEYPYVYGPREPKLARSPFDWRLVDLSNFCAVATQGNAGSPVPLVPALRVATAINDDERLDIRVKTKGLTERLNQRYSGKGAHDGLTQ